MMELLALVWPPLVFIPLIVFVIVRYVQAIPYFCDKCGGRPYNSVTGQTCGCDNGFKRMI
jgi:hypothetical protein